MENVEKNTREPECLTAELIVDDTHIAVPIERFVQLVRAETELAVLEAALGDSERSWAAEEMLKAIHKARAAVSAASAGCGETDA